MEPAGALRRAVPPRAATAEGENDRAAWRAFPFRWPDLGRFAVAWLVLTAVFLAVGLVLVHVLVHGVVGDVDREAARWFADRRTPTVDDLTQIGAGLADAYTVIPALLILSVLFVVLWRRWNETVLLLSAVLLEKAVFVTVTYIVDRPRPPVGQLDGHPPTSSFPSGHVASAVSVYGVVALIVWAHTDRRWLRALVVTVAVVVPVIVALSRLILGMHYLTDVTIGATLGVVALVVGTRLAARTVEDLDARRHLHRRPEAQQAATERDGAQREPGRAERGAGRDVAEPVHTEQHA